MDPKTPNIVIHEGQTALEQMKKEMLHKVLLYSAILIGLPLVFLLSWAFIETIRHALGILQGQP